MPTSILGRSAGTSSRKRSHPGYVTQMVLCLGFGAGLFMLSSTSFSDLGRQAGYASVQGQVVEASEERTWRNKRTRVECSLVVAYTVGGRAFRADDAFSGACEKHAGDAMTVRYDPSLPARATLRMTSEQKTWAWGGGAGAVLCGVVAPVALTARAVSRRRRRRRLEVKASAKESVGA